MNIRLQHVFSVELNDQKRHYIEEAFEDVAHIFADVSFFDSETAYCYKHLETMLADSICFFCLPRHVLVF